MPYCLRFVGLGRVIGRCKEEADSQWLHLYKGWPAEFSLFCLFPGQPSRLFSKTSSCSWPPFFSSVVWTSSITISGICWHDVRLFSHKWVSPHISVEATGGREEAMLEDSNLQLFREVDLIKGCQSFLSSLLNLGTMMPISKRDAIPMAKS